MEPRNYGSRRVVRRVDPRRPVEQGPEARWGLESQGRAHVKKRKVGSGRETGLSNIIFLVLVEVVWRCELAQRLGVGG